ncbi:hypothetical protein PAPYR_9699 [Paratrimastix pyriformis]|uniref:Uncharacterized protein n=1 Tax=Paratrimastix pyriformis TaxID=342808 RepID=A0ABQ8UAB7_9EUKA|nr:hypothetical protein PAPYR_9699 [Paratrimastix pyriformis]
MSCSHRSIPLTSSFPDGITLLRCLGWPNEETGRPVRPRLAGAINDIYGLVPADSHCHNVALSAHHRHHRRRLHRQGISMAGQWGDRQSWHVGWTPSPFSSRSTALPQLVTAAPCTTPSLSPDAPADGDAKTT